MKSREYLERIREIPALSRAVLKKIVVDGNTAVFHLVTDETYHEEDVVSARAVTHEFVPEGCMADVRVVKSVPGEERRGRAGAHRGSAEKQVPRGGCVRLA